MLEVLLALAVFVLATFGIVKAIGGTMDSSLLARDRAHVRALLESRLAYCLTLPPAPGKDRVINPKEAGGFTVRESLTPHSLTNIRGEDVPHLYRLTIQVDGPGIPEETAGFLLHHPGPFVEGGTP